MNKKREHALEVLAKQTTCRHFTGIHKDVCGAGIEYSSVRDHQPGYRMARWPCLTYDGKAATTCDKFSPYTAEEAEQIVTEGDRAVEKFLADLAAGNCPHCGVKVEEQTQVGPCVYAKPCGHRLGQGKAKKVMKETSNG